MWATVATAVATITANPATITWMHAYTQFAFLAFQLLGVEAFGEAEFWLGEYMSTWEAPR